MWFEKFWVEVLHLRHHTCGSWGPGPFPQVRCPPVLLARCGWSASRWCRHVDNSTAVHSDRCSSTSTPLVAPCSSPCRVHDGRPVRRVPGNLLRSHPGKARSAARQRRCGVRRRAIGGSGRYARTGVGTDLPNLCTFLGTTSRRVDRIAGRRPAADASDLGFRCPRSSTQLWTATCRRGPGGRWRTSSVVRHRTRRRTSSEERGGGPTASPRPTGEPWRPTAAVHLGRQGSPVPGGRRGPRRSRGRHSVSADQSVGASVERHQWASAPANDTRLRRASVAA